MGQRGRLRARQQRRRQPRRGRAAEQVGDRHVDAGHRRCSRFLISIAMSEIDAQFGEEELSAGTSPAPRRRTAPTSRRSSAISSGACSPGGQRPRAPSDPALVGIRLQRSGMPGGQLRPASARSRPRRSAAKKRGQSTGIAPSCGAPEADRPFQNREPLGRAQPDDAERLEPFVRPPAVRRQRESGLAPGPPVERERADSGGPLAVRLRVEPRVGRRIIALAEP